MLKNKQILIILIFVVTIFFPHITFAKSEIGNTCLQTSTNDDCEFGANLDCESSSIPPGKTLCTCWSDDDCLSTYGGATDGGNWSCVNDIPSLSYNLHYCKSSKGLKKFAIEPGLNPYYCLGFNSNTNQTECASVPTDLVCDSSINKDYLPSQFHHFTPKASKVSLPTCQKNKTLIDGGKYCKIYDECYSDKLDDCSKSQGQLYASYSECTKAYTPSSCDNTKPCGNNLYCINKQCYKQESLFETGQSCKNDGECNISGTYGACITAFSKTPVGGGTGAIEQCFTLTNIKNAQTMACGDGKICTKSDKTCKVENDCTSFGGTGICKDGFCWFDEISMKKYKEGPSLFGIQADLQIRKPILEINIPQLNFSDVKNQVDDEGYLHLPYIGEYITTIYKISMVIVSIIGIIMIIVVGAKITVLGGEERINGFKKIGQISIGLFIAWGSYAILYNINPDLVNFDVLKIKYIETEQIPDYLTHGETDAAVVPGKSGKKHGELSGQKWTIPGTNIVVELSKEDVCALEKLGKTQTDLAANITTVKFLGSSIKVNKFIAKDLQERFKALEASTDPAVVAWIVHLKDTSQHKSNAVNASGAWMANGHGSDVAFIKRFGGEVGISVGKGGLANTALANYIKLKISEKSGGQAGAYEDKNKVTRKMSPSSLWIAHSHSIGTGFDIDYPHNQTFDKRIPGASIPDEAGNIIEATGKFVWLRKADPAHIEYAPSLCD